jgi:hypothetical protein
MTLFDVKGRLVKRTVIRYKVRWLDVSRSKLQFRVKQLLKPIWYCDVVFEEFPVFGSRMHMDFYNASKRIGVEVNGPQHEKFNPFFHNNSPQSFVKGIKRDLTKHSWCERNGIRLVEIIESDMDNLVEFYHRIQDCANS